MEGAQKTLLPHSAHGCYGKAEFHMYDFLPPPLWDPVILDTGILPLMCVTAIAVVVMFYRRAWRLLRTQEIPVINNQRESDHRGIRLGAVSILLGFVTSLFYVYVILRRASFTPDYGWVMGVIVYSLRPLLWGSTVCLAESVLNLVLEIMVILRIGWLRRRVEGNSFSTGSRNDVRRA